ncbi:MAG: ABC-type transporter, integral rane subunit [Frankiales bacterium]|nr:ABC-type transporter, integral rane subunit [Frankiales bacterium]
MTSVRNSDTDISTDPVSAQLPDAVKLTKQRASGRLEAIALPLTWLAVIVVFSIKEHSTFFTTSNASSILASQAVLVFVTLGLIVPLIAGDFDLSIGSVVGTSALTIAILNVQHHWPIILAILVALAVGVVVGLINGCLTVLLGIDSLIVTLGMSTLLAGVTLWASSANTITGVSQSLINLVIVDRLLGIPLEFYYAIILALILWYVFQFTPLGQRLLVVGRNREVARLSGMRVSMLRIGALVTSAFIAALGGVLIVGTSGSAGPTTGVDLLLPAFAAAFLGSTTIKPGRFNPWGTVIAVYFLVTGITGLQLLGLASYVQNLFYGGALILAVSFSQIIKRRRIKRGI